MGQMEYIDFSGGAGPQDAAEDMGAGSSQSAHHFNQASSSQNPYLNPNFPAPMSCDIKPRLTKEQHDILEAHFQKQNKPNTNTKKNFADSLNVSLDKVNNWFQNRRAKSKQDAKKQAGTLNLFHGNHHASSDSETSPGFVETPSQYRIMLEQWTAEQQRRAPNRLGISPMQHTHEEVPQQSLYTSPPTAEQFNGFLAPASFHQDIFNIDDESNRKTITQEQFTAMEQSGGAVDQYGHFEDLEASFSGDREMMSAVFPHYAGDSKQTDIYSYPIGAPMSSYDSTIPSTNSEPSLSTHPSYSSIQNQAALSASTSDYTDSRSSSLHEDSFMPVQPHYQPASTTAQWRPGQSEPVDPNAQAEEFRQVAAQAAQARSSPQMSLHEQPLAWPEDDYHLRRGSSTSMLAHSLSHVGIQTPPQHQQATFKSPAPPSNIAARRQRAPRPAALGINSARSQSHSGAVPSGSPAHIQPPPNTADYPLRRIRSSNIINNGGHGRVTKSIPGSAQRSPLHYTFADAINSPHAVQHVSNGTLAPPTPMSPKEYSTLEQQGQYHTWPAASSDVRHASISETELEHGLQYSHSGAMLAHHWSSPPHTPMHYQPQFMQPRFHGHSFMENTPPQSAPASQTCFPSNIFAVPQQPQPLQQPVHSQTPVQHHGLPMAFSQPPPPMNNVVPVQQFQMQNVPFVPTHMPAPVPSSGMSFQFAQGVPIVNDDGNIEMAFPPQLQFMQQPSHGHTPPQQHMHTPPQASYPFVTTASASPTSQASAGPPKPTTDFFIHEYTPPESVKRSATPRKAPVDLGPKNYSFTNTGPEHFEEKKGDEKKIKKLDTKDTPPSSSPASSTGTALTS